VSEERSESPEFSQPGLSGSLNCFLLNETLQSGVTREPQETNGGIEHDEDPEFMRHHLS